MNDSFEMVIYERIRKINIIAETPRLSVDLFVNMVNTTLNKSLNRKISKPDKEFISCQQNSNGPVIVHDALEIVKETYYSGAYARYYGIIQFI